jgi:hypothetical protein
MLPLLADPYFPPASAARTVRTEYRIDTVPRGDKRRAGLEAFIAATFLATYGAELHHFSDTLIGVRGASGEWIAALGYTLAAGGPTFLEQYLDAPLEQEIAVRTGKAVERASIVEVGNLAAAHAGAARALIVRTTHLLHSLGLRWVAFTATPSLLNSFSRLRLQPQLLAPADPARLPDGGRHWGSYYNTHPHVMFGDISYGHEQLS